MTYRFGMFEFDDRAAILTRSDRPVALEPQPARALALLLARAGDVVTREELRTHLWSDDTHVDFDRGLAYCIGQLRAALGDSADNPRFVQTHPRRGFAFIAPVSHEQERSTFDVLRWSVDGEQNDEPVATNVEPRTPNDRAVPAVRSGLSAVMLATAAVLMLVIAGAGVWPRLSPGAPERPIVAVECVSWREKYCGRPS